MAGGLTWYFKLVDQMSGPLARVNRGLAQVNGRLRDARGRFLAGQQAMDGASASGGRLGGILGRVVAGGASIAGRAVGFVAGAALRLGTLGLAGAGLLARGIVALGSHTEDTRIALGGMLVASRAVGEGTGTERMNNGLRLAEGVMTRIRRQAAALPGETEDFVTVFRGALAPALQVTRDLNRISDLTSAVGAVGITAGIDGEQIGRDLNAMLAGRAGADVRTWQTLMPQVQSAARDLGLNAATAQQFNRLSAEQRFNLVERAIAGYGPMVNAFGTTWTAQWGTLVSSAREMFGRVTGPIFARLSAGLGRFNGWIERNGASIEAFATGLVDRGVAAAEWLYDAGRSAYERLVPFASNLWTTIQPHVMPLVTSLGNLAGAVGRTVLALGTQLMPLLPPLMDALRLLASGIAWVLDHIPGFNARAGTATTASGNRVGVSIERMAPGSAYGHNAIVGGIGMTDADRAQALAQANRMAEAPRAPAPAVRPVAVTNNITVNGGTDPQATAEAVQGAATQGTRDGTRAAGGGR